MAEMHTTSKKDPASLADPATGGRSLPTVSVSPPPPDNRVLARLPPSDRALLAPHLQLVILQPGLQHRALAPDDVYFPHDGLVSLLVAMPNGETMETASAGRGGAVCPIVETDCGDGLLGVVAPGAVRASRVAAARLQPILRRSEALSRGLAACREALLLQLRQNAACAGLHSVEQRLARWLLEAADRSGSDLIPVTQDEVAQRLGVRRTTVTLIASGFQEIRAIRWGRSRVHILDHARLSPEACTCYAVLRERIGSLLPADPPFPEAIART
jgi:CRP-like cAMP-binding protein